MKSENQIYKSDDILDNTYSVSHVKTSHFRKKKKSGCFSVTAWILLEMQVSKCLRNQNKCPPQRAQDAKHSQHSVKGIFGSLFCLASKTHLKWVKTKGFMGQRRRQTAALDLLLMLKKTDFTVLWYK